MDEVMEGEVRELPVRGLVGVLAVLLGVVLIVNQTFWGMMDGFLDSLLVPVAKTQEAAFGKVQSRGFCRENEGIKRERDLLLKASVIPKEPGLLLKDAVPTVAASDLVLPENPSTGDAVAYALIPSTVQPQVDGTAHLFTESGVPENNDLSVESTVPETMMPTTEKPSVIVPEYLPDASAIVAEIVSNLPESEKVVPEAPLEILPPEKVVPEKLSEILPPEKIVPEAPSHISTPEEIVAEDSEKPSVIVSEDQPKTPTSAEVITPDPVETDTIVPEKPAEEPIVPKPVVPNTEISDSDVTDNVPTEIVEEEGGEAVPVSCFLLDEAGMLYGFLPEYAEIVDGCLELPSECTGIRSGAFSGCGSGIVELYIPAGAAVIEEGAFSGLDNLEWIEVEGGNPGYTTNLGILFDSTMSVLVKFPSGRVSAYSIPPYVTTVAGGAFEGTSLYKLDIRNCADISFGGNAFGYSSGNGIEIAVPETQFDMYEQMLSGYAVTISK